MGTRQLDVTSHHFTCARIASRMFLPSICEVHEPSKFDIVRFYAPFLASFCIDSIILRSKKNNGKDGRLGSLELIDFITLTHHPPLLSANARRQAFYDRAQFEEMFSWGLG